MQRLLNQVPINNIISLAAERATTSLSAALCVKRGMRVVSDNENPSGVFFTLFLRSFILLRELEYVVERVGSRAKGDQRCARGFAGFAIRTQAWSEGLR